MDRLPEQRDVVGLLHDLPEVHDRHLVGDVAHDAQVVRDEQVRVAAFLLQLLEQVEDLRLDAHVERGHGFVEDDELRVERERPRNADALPAPPVEFVREGRRDAFGEAHRIHELLDFRVDLPFVPARVVDPQRLRNLLGNGHPRVQGRKGILEDDLRLRPEDAPLFGRELQRVLSVEEDLAGRGLDQADDDPSERRLAASGLPDEAERLSLADRQRYVVHGVQKAFADVEILLEAPDVEKGIGVSGPFAHDRCPPSTPSGK